MKTKSQIENEIWQASAKNNFYGKDMLIFINRFTGEERVYLLQEKRIEPRFIIQNDGTCELDPEECYGCNGATRARWQEALMEDQTKEAENY